MFTFNTIYGKIKTLLRAVGAIIFILFIPLVLYIRQQGNLTILLSKMLHPTHLKRFFVACGRAAVDYMRMQPYTKLILMDIVEILSLYNPKLHRNVFA